jgi:hypothetical protein
VRIFSLLVISGLAAVLAFAASGGQPNAEPSELQMQPSFGEFFSKLEARPISEIQFVAFKKRSCRSATTTGYYCSFTYSTKPPFKRFSVLPTQGTLSGMFISDKDGQLRFEMVVG